MVFKCRMVLARLQRTTSHSTMLLKETHLVLRLGLCRDGDEEVLAHLVHEAGGRQIGDGLLDHVGRRRRHVRTVANEVLADGDDRRRTPGPVQTHDRVAEHVGERNEVHLLDRLDLAHLA